MNKQKKETFRDFLSTLQEKKVTVKPIDKIEERRYFLIVCEGLRTEPIYFNYLKSFLPPNLLDTIDINGTGDNTVNVVRKAIAERDKRKKNLLKPPYDEVWAVFDKDDFPKKRYNDAIKLAEKEAIYSGHSNQSFELWYVLHFQYLDTAQHRKDYITTLSGKLGFPYQKNNEHIVKLLFEQGNVKRAIAWAKKLDQQHTGGVHADHCPQTKVYKLVETLLGYSRHTLLN